MVAEKKIDLEQVKPTGKDGRILKGDLISMMGANPQPNQRKIQFGEEERIKMSRLRPVSYTHLTLPTIALV